MKKEKEKKCPEYKKIICPHGCPWPHQKEHWHYKPTREDHLCEADEIDQMRALAPE